MTDRPRCPWPGGDPLYVDYHDREWGVPIRDGRALFGKLVLDGFQAGLAWITVLRKREHFLRAFEGFDPERVAAFDTRRIETLAADPGIIRSRAKIGAAVGNARAWIALRDAGVDFAELLWSFVGGAPRVNQWTEMAQIPAATPASEAMAKELKARGFKFVGPTICYAFMQAAGLVNDHLITCFRHRELLEPRPRNRAGRAR